MKFPTIDHQLVVHLIVFLLVPIVSTLASISFGVLLTQSPDAGIHRYSDILEMLPFAFFQAPFSLVLAVILQSKFGINNKSNTDTLLSASAWGAIVAVTSGLVASVFTVAYAIFILDIKRDFILMFFMIYFSNYFDFGFSVLSGMAAGVVSASFKRKKN